MVPAIIARTAACVRRLTAIVGCGDQLRGVLADLIGAVVPVVVNGDVPHHRLRVERGVLVLDLPRSARGESLSPANLRNCTAAHLSADAPRNGQQAALAASPGTDQRPRSARWPASFGPDPATPPTPGPPAGTLSDQSPAAQIPTPRRTGVESTTPQPHQDAGTDPFDAPPVSIEDAGRRGRAPRG